MKVTKAKIINYLKKELSKNKYIFACWLEGADSKNRSDKYSDLDIWLDVKDGYENKMVVQLKKILTNISPIDFFISKNILIHLLNNFLFISKIAQNI